MRWLVLVPFLARGVAACVDYPHNSIPSGIVTVTGSGSRAGGG